MWRRVAATSRKISSSRVLVVDYTVWVELLLCSIIECSDCGRMNLCVGSVLLVVGVLAAAGSSLGEDEGSRQSCAGTHEKDKIFSSALECLDTSGTDANLVLFYRTLEEHKDFFKTYCQKQPQIRECLEGVALTSQACLNETRHHIFLVLREMLETTLDAGCAQDGEVFANMVLIYKNNCTTASNMKPFYQCLETYANKAYTSLNRMHISDFSRNYILYSNILSARDCFQQVEEGDQSVQTGIVSLLNAIAEKQRCFRPEDDSVVLCNKLNLDPVGGPRICPIKPAEVNPEPLYNVLLEQIPMSLNVRRTDETRSLNDLASLEKSRIFVKSQCETFPIIRNNLQQVNNLSYLCLNDTHHLMLQTVTQFLTNAIDRLCIEDGRRLAYVVFKVISEVISTHAQTHVIMECAYVAHPPSEAFDTSFTSETSVQYYQKLKVFKECLVNKLKGDDVAVNNTKLLLNSVIDTMKCPNPELTTLVPCKSLDITN